MNQAKQIKTTTRHASELADVIDKSFDYSRDGEPRSGTGVWDDEISAFADNQTLKSLFFNEDWVYIVCDICAQKISATPLRVAKIKPNPNGITSEFAFGHSLNNIIMFPNPWQEYPSWMYLYVVEEVLGGNAINWFAPKSEQIMIMPFDQTILDFDQRGRLRSYMLSQGNPDQPGAETSTNKEGMTRFPADEVFHVRRPNPSSLLWGLSPFVPGRKAVLFNKYSSDYLNAFYLKQATPGMAITMDRTVNEELALRQLASFEMAHTGRRNMRRTLMLPKGTDVKPLTHTLADQRLVETVQLNRETIINLLKVPKHELNLNGAASLGSNEFRVALRNFWEATLIPIQKRISASMTMFFRQKKMLKENEILMFDNSDVDALKDDLLTKAEIAEKMAQTMPLNQVNAKIWQIDPIDDERADLPLSLAPSGNVTALIDDESAGTADPSETPVNPAGPEANQVDDEEADKSFAAEYLERNSEWLDNKRKRIKANLEEEAEKIKENTLDLFVAFAGDAIEVLKRELVEKARVPSRRRLRRKLQDKFEDNEEEYVEAYIETLKGVVEDGYLDTVSGSALDDKDKDALRAIRTRDLDGRRGILHSRGLETFSGMSKSQTERIMKQVERGIERGETISQITTNIANTFRDPVAHLKQAQRIARTETLTAVSVGENAAFENAVELDPKIIKVWINLGDSRVRGASNPTGLYPDAEDDHWKLQGQRRGKGKAFSNGLQYPRDLLSDNPAKVINCRCSLALERRK
jgi:phage portal protein BeeE